MLLKYVWVKCCHSITVHLVNYILTNAERNYDIANRELLAVKAALDEWRHCLEGARHLLRLIPTISYRPCTNNGKADACHDAFHHQRLKELLSLFILAPVSWDVNLEIEL